MTTATLDRPADEAEAVTTEIALIDLSSVAYPIYLMSGSQPDQDYTSTQVVARIRSLTANHPKAAICCDAGRSFRHDLAPTYKANRPEREAALHRQIALVKEQLAADGYPVWAVKGFEADDLIATAVNIALGLADTSVLVLSTDKDLLQLVCPRVRQMSLTNGTIYDTDAVIAKFGVRPDQMRDYLMLVGDASDNVKGAKGIGPKRAAALLAQHSTIDGIYTALTAGQSLPVAIAASLVDFAERVDEVRALITLRTDAEIPFVELDRERAPKDQAPMEEETMPAEAVEQPTSRADAPEDAATAPETRVAAAPAPLPAASQALAVREPDILAPAPAEWERQLEPRSIREAQTLAKFMFDSRMFSGYGTPAAVLSTVMAGRELGLQAIASLRAIHVVEGRHMLAADLLRGLVMRSGQAKYFRCSERSAERATFITHRNGDPEPVSLTYTIEEGRLAFGFYEGMPEKERAAREASWAKSGWGKNPADMCVARAGAKLARLVYPEITHGLYAREEFDRE